jgi:hypothetical protein
MPLCLPVRQRVSSPSLKTNLDKINYGVCIKISWANLILPRIGPQKSPLLINLKLNFALN